MKYSVFLITWFALGQIVESKATPQRLLPADQNDYAVILRRVLTRTQAAAADKKRVTRSQTVAARESSRLAALTAVTRDPTRGTTRQDATGQAQRGNTPTGNSPLNAEVEAPATRSRSRRLPSSEIDPERNLARGPTQQQATGQSLAGDKRGRDFQHEEARAAKRQDTRLIPGPSDPGPSTIAGSKDRSPANTPRPRVPGFDVRPPSPLPKQSSLAVNPVNDERLQSKTPSPSPDRSQSLDGRGFTTSGTQSSWTMSPRNHPGVEAHAVVKGPAIVRTRFLGSDMGDRDRGRNYERVPSDREVTRRVRDGNQAQIAVKTLGRDSQAVVSGRGEMIKTSIDARKSYAGGEIRSGAVGSERPDSPLHVAPGTKLKNLYEGMGSNGVEQEGRLRGKGIAKVTALDVLHEESPQVNSEYSG